MTQPGQPPLQYRLNLQGLAVMIPYCLLVLILGFILTQNYLNQVKRQQTRIMELAHDAEKRAMAVSYFFSERIHDLQYLARSRELSTFFENRALGMSMKYGLRSSLLIAVQKCADLIKEKCINHDPIYTRIVFLLPDKTLLIDTKTSDQPPQSPLIRYPELALDKKKPGIYARPHQMIVSIPYRFKHRYQGMLLAFIQPETVHHHLVSQSDFPDHYLGMVSRNGVLYCSGNCPVTFDKPGTRLLDKIQNNDPALFTGTGPNGKRLTFKAVSSNITGTPFQLVSLIRLGKLTDDVSLGLMLFGLVIFTIFGFIGVVLIWQNTTQKIVLKVRLDESIKNETRLKKKHAELVNEIRERKKMESALRNSEKRFRDLVDHLPIPFGEYGFDYTLTYANKAALAWMGLTEPQLKAGVKVSDLVSASHRDLIRSRLKRYRRGETPGPIELELTLKSGIKIWGQAISSPIYEKGVCTGIRSCFVDLTKQHQAKIALQQEKYALVGQVAGKMAHDFNNILGAIMGNAELSLEECQDESMCRTLEIILDQTQKGSLLTRNLVSFAKDQELQEEYFTINEKIDLVLSLLKKELEPIQVIRQFEPHIPKLLADPGMIENALMNLIQNAIHAMSRVKRPKLILKTRSTPEAIQVDIIDNGCGIPQKFQSEIYSPLFSLKGHKDTFKAYKPGIQGSGYGLANVKKYIEKHKGHIRFQTRVNQGTCFFISLPRPGHPALPPLKKTAAVKKIRPGQKILLVEDEPAISSVLEQALRRSPCNHQVTLVRSGQAALQAFDTESFDLVSLDYILSDNLTGLDVYHTIRKKDQTVPVIFVSGNIRFLESMEQIKTGDPRVDHLSKPCQITVYLEKINNWL